MNTTESERSVTIIGAGIIGLCTALALQQRGFQVRLLDRALPGQGASYGNAGVISPWSNVPQAMPGVWRMLPQWVLDPLGPVSVKLSYLHKLMPWALKFLAASQTGKVQNISDAMHQLVENNIADYRELLQGDPQQLLRDSSYVHVFRDKNSASLNTLSTELRRKWGAQLELVDAATLQDIEPALSHVYEAALIIKEQARTVAPGEIGYALAERIQHQGGSIIGCQVRAITPLTDGEWRVEMDGASERCSTLVLSAGAWSAELLKPLNIHIPMVSERGYHQHFDEPGIELNNSVMDTDHLFVASSMHTGIRLAGTAEFAGLNDAPNYKRAKIMSQLGKSMFPDLNTCLAEDWMGVRPSLPDSLPCLGAVPEMPGLHLAFGHSHYGMGMAPKSGELVARQIAGETLDINLKPYSHTRFN